MINVLHERTRFHSYDDLLMQLARHPSSAASASASSSSASASGSVRPPVDLNATDEEDTSAPPPPDPVPPSPFRLVPRFPRPGCDLIFNEFEARDVSRTSAGETLKRLNDADDFDRVHQMDEWASRFPDFFRKYTLGIGVAAPFQLPAIVVDSVGSDQESAEDEDDSSGSGSEEPDIQVTGGDGDFWFDRDSQ